jgi:hypothetical protein
MPTPIPTAQDFIIMRFEFTHVGGDAGHIAMFHAVKLVDDEKNTAYREKVFDLYYSKANPAPATYKDQFMNSMLIHARRNMREPTLMTETEDEVNVKTTFAGNQFYKVSDSTGKSNPKGVGHIREIVFDGMHNFAEAPKACADECALQDGSQSSGFDVTTQGGASEALPCVAFEIRCDDKNANIWCILWSVVPEIENEGELGVRGQYVMTTSSHLPQIALGLLAVGAGVAAYMYFKNQKPKPAKRGIVKPAQVFAAAPVHSAPEPIEVEEEKSGYFPLFMPQPAVEVVPFMQAQPYQIQSTPSAVVPMQSGSVGMAYAPSYGGSYGGGYGMMGGMGPPGGGYGMVGGGMMMQ